MSDFKDHFSTQSCDYSRYRPDYPPTLFDWLAAQSPATGLAWDVATGSGQAATALATRFKQVIATDGSSAQLASAVACPNVVYRCETAEHSSLADASVDLITVAQALHWFDHDAFYREVKRVLKPGGVLAAWAYAIASVDAPCDAVTHWFYEDITGPFWPPERRLVETGYRSIDFPFAEIAAPAMTLQKHWSLSEYLGYMSSWSAVARYRQQRGDDPMPLLEERLGAAWGDPQTRRIVSWPLALRAGRKSR